MENLENFVTLDLGSESFESKIKEEGAIYLRKTVPLRGVRKVVVAETVDTYLPDGTVESTKEAAPGDWVVTGPEAEEFVLSSEKFDSLYEEKEPGIFVPKERKIMALKNPAHTKIRIDAPWGTKEKPASQYGESQCILVIELDSEGNFTDNRYIIGDEVILESNYTLVK